MSLAQVVSELVGNSYPPAIAIEADWLRRSWVVRCDHELPAQSELSALSANIARAIADAIREACPALPHRPPLLDLVRLDAQHLIVRIHYALGDDASAEAIVNWGALQRLDARIRIADLQGIPAQHWSQISAARDSHTTDVDRTQQRN